MAGSKNLRKLSMVQRRRAPVGAPPGTLIANPEIPPPLMRLTAFNVDTIDEFENAGFETIEREINGERTLWLDISGVGDADLVSRVGAMFNIDRLALEDVMNLHQRPKLEAYDNHLYIVTHMFDGKSVTSREQFSLFLGDSFVVTFQERPGDCLDPVRKRLRSGKGRIRGAGADYLAYAILDAQIDAYFPLVETIGDRLEAIEERIIADPSPVELAELHRMRREILAVKRSLWPSREMLGALMRADDGYVSHDNSRFFRDTHDHVMQLVDIVETYRELATGLLEFYGSSISNRMNEVMKVLTIISTIFIPLGFLAGIWGMNFSGDSRWNMPELDWAYGYPVALGVMLFIALALIGLFRWKRWL